MTVLSILMKIPIIGPLLKIANAYAYQGDYKATYEFAGFWCWIRSVGPELTLAVALALATLWQLIEKSWIAKSIQPCAEEFYCKPGSLIVAFVPSTLGFGIGVYALIFGLSAYLVKDVKGAVERQKLSGKRKDGSELMLNSDMAFPLVVLTFSLFLGIFQQIFPGSIVLIALTWVVLWYAIISIFDLISVIFGMADNSLLEKTKD